jgi:hypothetical protein
MAQDDAGAADDYNERDDNEEAAINVRGEGAAACRLLCVVMLGFKAFVGAHGGS